MTEPQPVPDLEYDLAHDAATEGARGPLAAADPATVANATPNYPDGDYSYDLAHDVPGR